MKYYFSSRLFLTEKKCFHDFIMDGDKMVKLL